ncbi:MAG TPA: hypothetical protein VGT40_19490 [Methylomirabilota bacterium]|jgi:hypothetical protein|nr:hypothetical protein [Methylomirabilota bacterium]
MIRRRLIILALALLVVGCAGPIGARSEVPRARCLGQPGRGESYSGDRPLFFLFCVESP